MVARGWVGREGNEEKWLNGYSVSVWGNENDLGLDRGSEWLHNIVSVLSTTEPSAL